MFLSIHLYLFAHSSHTITIYPPSDTSQHTSTKHHNTPTIHLNTILHTFLTHDTMIHHPSSSCRRFVHTTTPCPHTVLTHHIMLQTFTHHPSSSYRRFVHTTGVFPPGHEGVEKYLNRPDVKAAIHATATPQPYVECADPPFLALSHQGILMIYEDECDQYIYPLSSFAVSLLFNYHSMYNACYDTPFPSTLLLSSSDTLPHSTSHHLYPFHPLLILVTSVPSPIFSSYSHHLLLQMEKVLYKNSSKS